MPASASAAAAAVESPTPQQALELQQGEAPKVSETSAAPEKKKKPAADPAKVSLTSHSFSFVCFVLFLSNSIQSDPKPDCLCGSAAEEATREEGTQRTETTTAGTATTH